MKGVSLCFTVRPTGIEEGWPRPSTSSKSPPASTEGGRDTSSQRSTKSFSPTPCHVTTQHLTVTWREKLTSQTNRS